MELHCCKRQVLMLNGHYHVVAAVAGGAQAGGKAGLQAVQGVVPGHLELFGQALEYRVHVGVRVLESHAGGLAVHGVAQHAQGAPKVLHHALQTQAHPERRQPPLQQLVDGGLEVEVVRVAWTRGEHHQVKLLLVQQPECVGSGAAGEDVGAGLAEVVAQGVHEGVLVVDQQHPLALPRQREVVLVGLAPLLRGLGLPRVGADDGVDLSQGLELGLLLLGVRHAVKQQRRPRPHLRHTLFDAHCPQGESSVQVPVEPNQSHCSTIPVPRAALLLFDELDRPFFGRTRHRHRPGVAKECVQRIEPRPQVALDMVHRVDQAGVHLNLAATQHLDGARHADARLVVPVHVSAHGQLRLLLGVHEYALDLASILQGVAASGDGPADGAGLHPGQRPFLCPHRWGLTPDKHLRGGPHQVLLLPQVQEQPVGGRVPLLQALEYLAGAVGAGVQEVLAEDHLEQVPTGKLLACPLHLPAVVPGGRVAFTVSLGGPYVRVRYTCPLQALGGVPPVAELVSQLPGRLLLLVHHQYLVGQVEHQVALGVGLPGDAQVDGVELEGQVVAQRPVQAQLRVPPVPHQLHHLSDDVEQAGLLGPLLLGEVLPWLGLLHATRHPAFLHPALHALHHWVGLEGVHDGGQQRAAPLVQHLDAEVPPRPHHLQRRFRKAQGPAGVTAGEDVRGREEHALVVVQGLCQLAHHGLGLQVVQLLGAHVHLHPAVRHVGTRIRLVPGCP
mmetsp:Transcript_15724/g.23114  ORF Transcript_15724/g.23114 Transcript_15724/m.23114 type:complete len:727 (-) Transcript_15724:225-2405(-)